VAAPLPILADGALTDGCYFRADDWRNIVLIQSLPNQWPWEEDYKDMVVAYPLEITTIKAKFDIPGLYVWHCHILEHEDHEMTRPFVVSPAPASP
jgi:FtsP/CotA-like multicopper oxidase with cupredoxin domain